MAKKKKKQSRRSVPASSRSSASRDAVSATRAAVSAPREVGRSFDRDFNPDYSFIAADLKRIGILAGSFLVILIVLSFFL